MFTCRDSNRTVCLRRKSPSQEVSCRSSSRFGCPTWQLTKLSYKNDNNYKLGFSYLASDINIRACKIFELVYFVGAITSDKPFYRRIRHAGWYPIKQLSRNKYQMMSMLAGWNSNLGILHCLVSRRCKDCPLCNRSFHFCCSLKLSNTQANRTSRQSCHLKLQNLNMAGCWAKSFHSLLKNRN